MTANPHPLLADPLPPESTLSLDERILRTEQRLIAREENLQRGLHTLGLRARAALRRPRELVLPALGGVAALGGLWWGTRGKRSAGGAAAAPAGRAAPAGSRAVAANAATGSRLPWVRLVSLGWPLLPKRLRARVDPTTVTAAMTVGLPLLEALLGSGSPPKPPLRSALQVDLKRYAGTWYEIARLPAPFESPCEGQPTATYTARSTPRGTEVDVVNRCRLLDGRTRDVRGIAKPVKGAGGARLKISLLPAALRWLPFAWVDYWVLYVDDAYSVALVGNPSRNFLWVLARHRRLPPSQLQALVEMASEQGFPVQRLKVVEPR